MKVGRIKDPLCKDPYLGLPTLRVGRIKDTLYKDPCLGISRLPSSHLPTLPGLRV